MCILTVEYGRAFAIDANGARIAVGSSYEGGVIGLHVPGPWIARAAFPVIVDPLTSRRNLHTFLAAAQVEDIDSCTAGDGANPHTLLVVHSRVFAGGDVDAFGFVYDRPDYTGGSRIWDAVSATESAARPRCAFSRPANMWVLVYERHYIEPIWGLEETAADFYVQDRSNPQPCSGCRFTGPKVAGNQELGLDVGSNLMGAGAPPDVLVAFEIGSPNRPCSGGVYSFTIHPPTRTASPEVWFAGGTSIAACRPAVSDNFDGLYGVAWQERPVNDPNDTDWDIRLEAFGSTGAPLGALAPPIPFTTDKDETDPVLAGNGRDALLACEVTDRRLTSVSRGVEFLRFRWLIPGVQQAQVLRRSVLARRSLPPFPVLEDVAFDHDTESHWCLLHRLDDTLSATRVGYTGAVTERGDVASNRPQLGPATASFSQDLGAGPGWFDLVYADHVAQGFLGHWGVRMTYPSAAAIASYGPSCNGLRLEPVPERGQPFAGNGNFGVQCVGTFPGAGIFHVLSFATVDLPLGPLGAPGCSLLVDLSFTLPAALRLAPATPQ